jgi:hypothetical protein
MLATVENRATRLIFDGVRNLGSAQADAGKARIGDYAPGSHANWRPNSGGGTHHVARLHRCNEIVADAGLAGVGSHTSEARKDDPSKVERASATFDGSGRSWIRTTDLRLIRAAL